jgi:hypothetical protein
LILNTINPQLVSFSATELQKNETEEYVSESLNQVTSSIEVEIPPSTIIENWIFDEERLDRILNIAKSTAETAENASTTSNDLEELTSECTCSDTEPCECFCSCQSKESLKCLLKDGEGNCTTWTTEYGCELIESEGEDSCEEQHCSGDPCKNVRSDITAKKNENNDANVKELVDLQAQMDQEILDLNMQLDKLITAMKLMMDCPISSLADMLEYNSTKTTYDYQGWKLKKVQYWEEITNINLNAATFYCPAGGTTGENEGATISEEEEQMYLDLAETEIENSADKEESQITCYQPVPLGEIFDYTASTTQDLVNRMMEMSSSTGALVTAIDKLHQNISDCTAADCTPVCYCDDLNCSLSKKCEGNVCSDISANEIRELAEDIENLKEKIRIIKEEKIPPILETLGYVKQALTAGFFEDSSGENGLLRTCSQVVGNIKGDWDVGEVIEQPADCKYEFWSNVEGIITFDLLDGYNCNIFSETNNNCSSEEECQETLTNSNNCVAYNLFFCRYGE